MTRQHIHQFGTARLYAPGPETEPELWPHLVQVAVTPVGNPPEWCYVILADARTYEEHLYSFAPDAPGAERWTGEHRA